MCALQEQTTWTLACLSAIDGKAWMSWFVQLIDSPGAMQVYPANALS
jgi:hypothetical protein